jgi:perosamine synthetase
MINDPDLFIVEDAAQAMGSRVNGAMLGMTGDVGFFSLGRGKALSAVEGGVVLTDRDDIGEALAKKYVELEEYGVRQTCVLFVYALALWMLIRPSLFWLPRALPFLRLGETIYDPDFPMRTFTGLQAGLTRHWQRNLAAFHAVRRARVAAWRRTLKSMCEDDALPLLRYPIMLDSAAEASRVVRESNRQGLGIAPSYPEPVHRVPALTAEFSGQDFPAATEAARRLVTLPVHGYVREADRERVLRMFQAVRAEGKEEITLGTVHG